MTRRLKRAGFVALVVGALMLPVTVPTFAADAATEEPGELVVDMVKGKKQKFARTDVGKWLRATDALGDVATAGGVPIVDAHGSGDIKRVSLIKGKTTNKLSKVWPKDYPFGAADAYQGENSQLRKKQNVVFLIIETDGSPPRDELPSVQVFVGADGSAAQPVIPSTRTPPTGGLEQFSRSGVFKGGVFGSGTTFLGDTAPGEPFDLYGGVSQDRGYHNRKKQAWYHIAYVPKDAKHITVAIQSDQDGVQAYDYLTLPTGERFLDLGDKYFGFPRQESPIVCREVRTVQADAIDTDAIIDEPAFWVDFTVGFADDFDVRQLDGQRAEFDLQPFDPEAAEALLVEAGWTPNPAMNSATARVLLPGGTDRWRGSGRFLADDDAGFDPALTDRFIALAAATGAGGFLVGPSHVGHLGGDIHCGRFVHDGATCDLFDTQATATLAGMEADEFDLTDFTSPAGLHICAGVEIATGQPGFIGGYEDAFVDLDTYLARIENHACPASPVDGDPRTFILDCGAEGFESIISLVTPAVIQTLAPEGGYVTSVDVRTELNDDSDPGLDWASYPQRALDTWQEQATPVRRWNDSPALLGSGEDTIEGEAGEAGEDTIEGEAGEDTIEGEAGEDIIEGG